jgi:hypothetical protein
MDYIAGGLIRLLEAVEGFGAASTIHSIPVHQVLCDHSSLYGGVGWGPKLQEVVRQPDCLPNRAKLAFVQKASANQVTLASPSSHWPHRPTPGGDPTVTFC